MEAEDESMKAGFTPLNPWRRKGFFWGFLQFGVRVGRE